MSCIIITGSNCSICSFHLNQISGGPACLYQRNSLVSKTNKITVQGAPRFCSSPKTKMPGPSLQKRGASQREGKINKSPKWELPTLILNHQNLTVGKLSTREFIKNSLKTSHYHNHDQRKFSNEQLSTMIFYVSTWIWFAKLPV